VVDYFVRKKTDRDELAKLLDRLEADDVLIVTRLDRLASSTRRVCSTSCR
jgi:DNA invertase Pin-like site-specific DNA recombinase